MKNEKMLFISFILFLHIIGYINGCLKKSKIIIVKPKKYNYLSNPNSLKKEAEIFQQIVNEELQKNNYSTNILKEDYCKKQKKRKITY